MSDTSIDVGYIAKLTNIKLTEEEKAIFTEDLNKILGYMTQLRQFDVEGVEPMYHPLPIYDVMRKDVCAPGLSTEEALSNAPDESDGQIRVPKVVESAS